ncbi:MAG: uroporphyrinogen decarboxylase family protein [Candidatus Bipolaricaulota bacterium]
MNSKCRVKEALTGEEVPDRVPVQFDLCAELLEGFSDKLDIPAEYRDSYYEDLRYRISGNGLRTEMGSDCVVVGGGHAEGYEEKVLDSGHKVNEFGMEMRQGPLYMEVVEAPLADIEGVGEAEKYEFPDPRAPGRYEGAEKDIEEFGDDYYVIGDCELTMFEMAWHLVGMEKFLRDLMLGEEYTDVLLHKSINWTRGVAEELAERGVDALWFGDDVGAQDGLLLSPDLWRDKFKPKYKELFDRVKEIDDEVTIIFHSDGAVAPLIDDLIEIGVDVFNPVQPGVPGHEPRELKDRFGDRISFFGSIDQQQLLPEGSAEEIESDVRSKVEVLGEGGGFMIAPAHIIQSDTSMENVETFIESALKYGEYD